LSEPVTGLATEMFCPQQFVGSPSWSVSNEREIELATAFGFFSGFGLGTLILVVDSLT
jgi:hypothetical protein